MIAQVFINISGEGTDPRFPAVTRTDESGHTYPVFSRDVVQHVIDWTNAIAEMDEESPVCEWSGDVVLVWTPGERHATECHPEPDGLYPLGAANGWAWEVDPEGSQYLYGYHSGHAAREAGLPYRPESDSPARSKGYADGWEDMARATRLTFGYKRGLVPGVDTAWGARAIVTQSGAVELVRDRQSAFGETSAVNALLDKLNGGINQRWIAEAAHLLRSGRMATNRAEDFTLYRGADVTVRANTLASSGYLYVVAYPTRTHTTRAGE